MKKGFTLVELVAAVVILTVIFAIAFPKVNKYIESSKIEAFKEVATELLKLAEGKYIELKTSGSALNVSCDELASEKKSYNTCTITFDNSKAVINITGKGKFDGMSIINGTLDNLEVSNS